MIRMKPRTVRALALAALLGVLSEYARFIAL